MINEKRWKIAQESEKKYWENRAKNIEQKYTSALGWYEWRANELDKILIKIGFKDYHEEYNRILEIGCGPVGMISYFPGKYKIGLDPLNSYYETNQYLVEMRKDDVEYRDGIAEKLEFENNSFDLVIIENCIDHVKNKEKAMNEIYRVLRKKGLLYLTVNCRARIGYYVHRVLSNLKIDKGHPHTFTKKKINKFLEMYLFKILYLDNYSNYRDALIFDLKSKEKRNILKAFLGVSEFLVRTISKKES